MIVKLVNHDRKYDVSCIALLFMPGEKISFTNSNDWQIKSSLKESSGTLYAETLLKKDSKINKSVSKCKSTDDHEINFALMRSFYNCLSKGFKIRPDWGILTGIRPSKVAETLINEGNSANITKDILVKKYLISNEKAELCVDTALYNINLSSKRSIRDISIYISIPFCPSKCNYCSFVSSATEKLLKLIPEYIIALKEEISRIADVVKLYSLTPKTLYIGGGTPSILTSEQLSSILSICDDKFDFNKLDEITVECGRPDTITADKLKVLSSYDKIRICINPQTLSDEILIKIGRRHTVSDFIEKYTLAKECGIKNINTDLIAGLRGETFDSFKNSIDKIIELSPSNITVHTLCIKRASVSNTSGNADFNANNDTVNKMVNYSYDKLVSNGYKPYYMYKQRNTISNLENIGYTKIGAECKYNIYMMNEIHTVIGIGAGAVTKCVGKDRGIIERLPNYKYPNEYISDKEKLDKNIEQLKTFLKENL